MRKTYSHSYLEERLKRELGGLSDETFFRSEKKTVRLNGGRSACCCICPLEMRCSAVYSVIEGLLTGNVNILKLPPRGRAFRMDSGGTDKTERRISHKVFIFACRRNDGRRWKSWRRWRTRLLSGAATRRFLPYANWQNPTRALSVGTQDQFCVCFRRSCFRCRLGRPCGTTSQYEPAAVLILSGNLRRYGDFKMFLHFPNGFSGS